MHIRYYSLRHGHGFYRRVYSTTEQNNSMAASFTLVHYVGDHSKVTPMPHGNRNNHLERNYTKTFPSTLKSMANQQHSPKAVYCNLVSTPCSSVHVPSALPKNVEQVRNKMKNEKRKTRISKDDLYSLNAIANCIPKYVLNYILFPRLILVFGVDSLWQELKSLKEETKFVTLSYDTRFNLGDYFLSVLLLRHGAFKENPIIPLAFLLHQKKDKECHTTFFRTLKTQYSNIVKNAKNIIIITDRKESIVQAIMEVFPNWNHCLAGIIF